jgi:hypothetical protein
VCEPFKGGVGGKHSSSLVSGGGSERSPSPTTALCRRDHVKWLLLFLTYHDPSRSWILRLSLSRTTDLVLSSPFTPFTKI